MKFFRKLFKIPYKYHIVNTSKLSTLFKYIVTDETVRQNEVDEIFNAVIKTGRSYPKWGLYIKGDAESQDSACFAQEKKIELHYNRKDYSLNDIRYIITHELRHVQQHESGDLTSGFSIPHLMFAYFYKGETVLGYGNYGDNKIHARVSFEQDANRYAMDLCGFVGYKNKIIMEIIKETVKVTLENNKKAA